MGIKWCLSNIQATVRGHTASLPGGRQELSVNGRMLVPHMDDMKEEMEKRKEERKKMVNKNDPWSLENERSLKSVFYS